jgi:hypothetical protein
MIPLLGQDSDGYPTDFTLPDPKIGRRSGVARSALADAVGVHGPPLPRIDVVRSLSHP